MLRSVPILLLVACADEGPAAVVPEAVDLGRLGAGHLAVFDVPVRAGREPLEVVRATAVGGAFGTVVDATLHGLEVTSEAAHDVLDGAHVVEAGHTFGWPFVVLPGATGRQAGVARFELADGDALEVSLTADVVVPEVTVGPPEVSFGAVSTGELEVARLQLHNLDDVVLALDATFADPDVFSTLEPQPFLLDGGRSSPFEIAAAPASGAGIRSELVLSVVGEEVARVTLVVDPSDD